MHHFFFLENNQSELYIFINTVASLNRPLLNTNSALIGRHFFPSSGKNPKRRMSVQYGPALILSNIEFRCGPGRTPRPIKFPPTPEDLGFYVFNVQKLLLQTVLYKHLKSLRNENKSSQKMQTSSLRLAKISSMKHHLMRI